MYASGLYTVQRWEWVSVLGSYAGGRFITDIRKPAYGGLRFTLLYGFIRHNMYRGHGGLVVHVCHHNGLAKGRLTRLLSSYPIRPT